jgi:hypothetical protein
MNQTRARHNVVPDASGAIVEAWGETRAACLEELVRAIASMWDRPLDTSVVSEVPFEIGAALDDDLASLVFDDVVRLAVTDGLAVVDVAMEEGEDGEIYGTFFVVPVDHTAGGPLAAPPRRSLLWMVFDGVDWRCRAAIDVAPPPTNAIRGGEGGGPHRL